MAYFIYVQARSNVIDENVILRFWKSGAFDYANPSITEPWARGAGVESG